jgi:hypothetical protein
MILIFNYKDKIVKFFPNENIDVVQYAKDNLPSGTKYKVIQNIEEFDPNILDNPDGYV